MQTSKRATRFLYPILTHALIGTLLLASACFDSPDRDKEQRAEEPPNRPKSRASADHLADETPKGDEGVKVVLIADENCSASDSLVPVFERLRQKYEDKAEFVIRQSEDVSAGEARRLGMRFQFPWISVLRDGRIVDLQFGAYASAPEYNKKALMHLLARNRIIAESPEKYVIEAYPPSTQKLRSASVLAQDIEGIDFSNCKCEATAFSGSNLQGADFSNATLKNAVMSHANLEGANFEGADLLGVRWVNAVCPDGTRIENPNETCRGHLQPTE